MTLVKLAPTSAREIVGTLSQAQPVLQAWAWKRSLHGLR